MSGNDRLGKYFVIRNKSKPFLVLEVKGGVDRPGVGVILNEFEDSWVDRQMWYLDTVNGVMHNKLNHFCLDIRDDAVVVEPYSATSTTQRWVLVEGRLQTAENCEVVVSVQQGPVRPGAPCGTAVYTGEDGQLWAVEHCPAQYFYIRSVHNLQKVLDVRGEATKPGSKVIVYNDKGTLADNQMWFEDESGIIRSKINGFILDGSSEKEVTVRDLDDTNSLHKWIYDSDYIRCRSDTLKVLEYRLGGVLFGEDCVVPARYKSDQPLQQWKLDLVPQSSSALNHRGDGKHFIIRNRFSGLVLEVKDGNKAPGTPIVTAFREQEVARQLFYVEDVSGTIRSQLNDLCVDGEDGVLKMNPYDPYSRSQQWKIAGHKIQCKEKHDIVWELSSVEPEPGITVKSGPYTDSDHQRWEKSHVPAHSFYIVSKMNGRVLDVCGEKASTGASVIVYERKNDDTATNQMWYEDENGVIRSRLNGYVLDSSQDGVRMRPFDPTNTHQYWMVVGDRLQNKYDNRLVLDIAGESNRNGAPVCAYRYMGGDNQRWTFQSVQKTLTPTVTE